MAVTFLSLLSSLPSHASPLDATDVDARPASVPQPVLTTSSPFTQLGITSESIAKSYSKDFDTPVFWFDRPWQQPSLFQSNGYSDLSLQPQHTASAYRQQRQFISTPTLTASVRVSYSPSLGICCSSSKPSGFSADERKAKTNTTSLNPSAFSAGAQPNNSAKLIPSSAHLALLTHDGVPVNFNQMHQQVAAAGKGRNFNWHLSSRLDQYHSAPSPLSDKVQQTRYWAGEGQSSWSTGAVELTIGIQFARFDHRENFVERNCQFDSCEANRQTFTGSVQLAFQLKQNLASYINISKGENAGFKFTNALSAAPLEMLPSTNYRLGLRNAFMDNTLSINTALYYSDTDDSNPQDTAQLSTSGTENVYFWNDSLTNTQGFEVEGLYAMTDTIALSLGISYTDPIYAAGNTASRLEQQLSPLWHGSASFFVEDTLPGTKWQYLVNLNLTHVGQTTNESSFNPANTPSMMTVVSSQVGIRSPSSRYNLLVWSHNMDSGNITIDTTSTDLRNVQQSPKSSYGITFTAILGY